MRATAPMLYTFINQGAGESLNYGKEDKDHEYSLLRWAMIDFEIHAD